MPASKVNYLVVYNNHSQIYGSASKKIAIDSPPPEGLTEEDKNIFFLTFEPDTKSICLYKVNNQEEENDKKADEQEKD